MTIEAEKLETIDIITSVLTAALPTLDVTPEESKYISSFPSDDPKISAMRKIAPAKDAAARAAIEACYRAVAHPFLISAAAEDARISEEDSCAAVAGRHDYYVNKILLAHRGGKISLMRDFIEMMIEYDTKPSASERARIEAQFDLL